MPDIQHNALKRHRNSLWAIPESTHNMKHNNRRVKSNQRELEQSNSQTPTELKIAERGIALDPNKKAIAEPSAMA